MQRADGGVASWLLLFASTPQSIRLVAYCQLPGRGAFNSLSLAYGSTAPLLRRATPVGTRSPYSLPFVILPVPARSPFRLLVHRTRSTPNLGEGAFWCATNQKLSPFTGKVDTKWPKGERLNQPKSPSYSPSVGSRRQLPRKRWSLFARFYLNFILAPP